MKRCIVYIECKANGITGRARIGRVSFSKSVCERSRRSQLSRPTLLRMAKRAKRRRRERKRERRGLRLPTRLVLTPAGLRDAPPFPTEPRGPLPDDSPGDQVARDLSDDEDGGAPVREPRRPKPNAPMAGAATVEPPSTDESTKAVSSDL